MLGGANLARSSLRNIVERLTYRADHTSKDNFRDPKKREHWELFVALAATASRSARQNASPEIMHMHEE